MKTYRIYQINSFTRNRFHGNPAGVVPNADGLSDEQMQKIARELNNSETAFIFSSNSKKYDVEVKFFTPTVEVPICGHATIAAHYVRAIEGTKTIGRTMQKTKAGILPVDIVKDGYDYNIIMTQGKPKVSKPFSKDLITQIADALGINVSDMREDCPIAIASTGHPKIMVGISSNKQLHSLTPNLENLIKISKKVGCNGYYVFTLQPEEEVLVHGRMFAPAIGIVEDPVTGNANGPLGVYLVKYGICKQLETDKEFSFNILQGEAINRDGGMKVKVKIRQGEPIQVQIVGEAVVVFQTEIVL